MKNILTIFSQKHSQIFKAGSLEDKFDGLLAILEEGVQESRELFLEKTLVSE